MPPPNEIEPCIIAYLAGYIIFTLTQSSQFCDHCLEELQQERSASPYLAYINLLGNQKKTNKRVFTFIYCPIYLYRSRRIKVSKRRNDFPHVDNLHLC